MHLVHTIQTYRPSPPITHTFFPSYKQPTWAQELDHLRALHPEPVCHRELPLLQARQGILGYGTSPVKPGTPGLHDPICLSDRVYLPKAVHSVQGWVLLLQDDVIGCSEMPVTIKRVAMTTGDQLCSWVMAARSSFSILSSRLVDTGQTRQTENFWRRSELGLLHEFSIFWRIV